MVSLAFRRLVLCGAIAGVLPACTAILDFPGGPACPADAGTGAVVGSPCATESDCCGAGLTCNENWAICVVGSCRGQPNFKPCERVDSPDRSYDICVNGSCVSPGCGDATCNAPGPNWPLADTSQGSCYNDSTTIACPGTAGSAGCETTAFCGQDAQYGWDVDPTHTAATRFTRTTETTEPVVTDNVTGLMWMGCSAGRTGDSCAGTDDMRGWNIALSYCDGRSWGGHSDWRLPDRYELQSIVDFGRSSAPSIDPMAFPETPPASSFWSSSSDNHNSLYEAWAVNFGSPSVVKVGKRDGRLVRCVRREP